MSKRTSAPASTAASINAASSRRRGHTAPCAEAETVVTLGLGHGSSRTLPAGDHPQAVDAVGASSGIFNSSSAATARGVRPSPHTLSRPYGPFSNTTTRAPAAGSTSGRGRAGRPTTDHRDVEALVHAPLIQSATGLFGVLLMMVDDLGNDEAQELLREHRVETGLDCERPQTSDLLLLAGRVGGRQADLRLVAADLLRDLEPLGEQVDEGGVDVVDARPVTRRTGRRVGRCRTRCGRRPWLPATLPCPT